MVTNNQVDDEKAIYYATTNYKVNQKIKKSIRKVCIENI